SYYNPLVCCGCGMK
ncbi:hypothetical protein SOVF_071940, partial [Spinacia oleracea]